jgi:hypothetical protein
MTSRRNLLRGAVTLGAGVMGSLAAGRVALADGRPPVAVLLSGGKPATASSVENPTTPASAAVDGNPGTRWSSQFSDPQWIQIDLGATYAVAYVVLHWQAAYAKGFEIRISVDGVHWDTPFLTTQDIGGTERVDLNAPARYVKMYGTVRGTQYGYSLYEFEVFGGPYVPERAGNIALGCAAAASSLESAHYPASAAFDGSLTTRWSSGFADAQWLQVDLGQLRTVTAVVLLWQAAYAVEYGIWLSPDAVTWSQEFYTTTGFGGDVRINTGGYPPVRYVQMRAFKRATQYGYSLWEMAVYGG